MKKSNSLVIVNIVILVILGVSVCGFMIGLLVNRENVSFTKYFGRREEKVLLDSSYDISKFKEINIDTKSSDVIIRHSNDGRARVVIYGDSSSEASSTIDDGSLNISKYSKSNFCIGFCFYEDKDIILYLPSDIKSNLNISASSGDIDIDDFLNLSISVNVKSGDVDVKRVFDSNIVTNSGDVEILSTENSNIKTSSGNINVKNVRGKINYTTKSGDIEIGRFDILENSSISTLSGSVEIASIGKCYVDTKTFSGDVDIKNSDRFSKVVLSINTSSGDIDIK